jgi:hypothetical protein
MKLRYIIIVDMICIQNAIKTLNSVAGVEDKYKRYSEDRLTQKIGQPVAMRVMLGGIIIPWAVVII